MLILHRVAPGGHRYYLRAVGEDARRGEVPGEWIMGATQMGLVAEGPVIPAQLQRALPTGTARVAAFDATFAAPKSVSILHGIGSAPVRAEVEAAHDEGVRAGLLFLERHSCAVRSRGAIAPTAGLVVAGFRHRVSRALDPHLHTHALIANQVAAPDDGRPLALHSPLLYGSRRAAGAVYQAVLRRRLTASLGLTWSVPIGGRADAQVVPSRVRSAFSIRGRQVVAASGYAIADRAWAARVTRPPRDGLIDIEALRASWVARAETLGWEVPALEPGVISAPVRIAVPVVDRWTRGDVMVLIADGCRSGATLDELEAACDRAVRDPQVIGVGSDNWHATPRFTTRSAADRRARLLPSRQIDGRPEAIDRMRRTAAGRVLLLTPDAPSAAALGARTGATACAAATAATAMLGPHDLVVLVRPDRIESLVLERALRSCRAEVAIAVSARGEADPTRAGRYADGHPWGASLPPLAARVDVAGGSVVTATDARSAAELAIASWVEARRLNRPAVLVALPDEVELMSGRARRALLASGLRHQEVSGWAVGDLAWFDAGRPALGVDRHTLAEVVAVSARAVTLAAGGRELRLGIDQMRTVRSGWVVPPVPSLVASGRELFVIGGWLPPGCRGRGPVHRHLTVDAHTRGRDQAIDRSRSI
ncbi:MAG: hypothetical protein NVSMB12_16040 [Acidimicrobiales bacterium]